MLINYTKRTFDRRNLSRSRWGDIHPNVVKWRKNAISAGSGYVSQNTMRAVDAFYKGLAKAGILNKMISVNCYVPDNLIASIAPLIHVNQSTWTNNNFVAADLNKDGLIGNGSNKYLNTNINPSLIFPNDLSGGITIYSSIHVAENAYGAGSQTTDGTQCMMLYYLFSGTTYWDCWNQSVGGRINATNTAFRGYISANRISAARSDIFSSSPLKLHSSIASTTTTNGTRPNFNIYVHCGNVSGNAQTFSSRRYSFVAIHYGLTELESIKFYTLIQSLRQRLGGGYV